ncbi:MAG: hypothetical protein AAGB19_22090 [Cyanobacteria bacterium P01_F01_bin.3]
MIATPQDIRREDGLDYTVPRMGWSEADFAAFGLKNQLFHHRYHELPLFQRDTLIDVLDDYPREWLQAFTMGPDPTIRADWQSVDIHPDSSGQDIWNAVEKGRLWLNLIFLQKYSQKYADIVEGMYDYVG